MKICNLYCGIGGNRKLWGDEHEITAVEYKPEIAAIYQDFWPNDKVVVGDAHQYLLEHYSEFDFIWSSPPCITHSRTNIWNALSPYKENVGQLAQGGGIVPRYADMALYQEIILLTEHFKGKFCVENVVSYYEPLIRPLEFGSHYFWVNFPMPPFAGEPRHMHHASTGDLSKRKGFDLSKYKTKELPISKEKILRNCVEPELGKHILDWSQKEWHHTKQLIS